MTHIPMLDLKREYEYMKADIDAAIARCLDHQKWILGPEVKEFEDKVAEYLNVEYCIGTSSGTDALVLALRALAIKTKGQEYFDRSDLIITTPFTFTATGDAILRAGATPLFVDIDPATFNLDPERIRECLQASALSLSPSAVSPSKVVGILPVHLYGQPCQMDEIMSIADENGLFVLEDVAQAFGAIYGGRRVGSIGTCGAFSFFPSKNLGGFGDAGMVSTNDEEIAALIRMLIKHGGKDKYNVDHIGYNARIDTLQAAILVAKLKYIDEFNSRRRRIAQLYIEGLKDLPGIVLPLTQNSKLKTQNAIDHVFHQFTLRVPDGPRDVLQQHLRDSSIDSMVYYPIPLHKMRVFSGRCIVNGELSEAERAAEEVLSLPMEPLMQYKEAAPIIGELRRDRTRDIYKAHIQP
ncbi:MAG: DegT/DnrJ/EryC1/StrS family aminotransferase [Syntrophales bacterium]|jgi:dTDP-4-amino-4,6-dideoxygalactose transaminase